MVLQGKKGGDRPEVKKGDVLLCGKEEGCKAQGGGKFFGHMGGRDGWKICSIGGGEKERSATAGGKGCPKKLVGAGSRDRSTGRGSIGGTPEEEAQYDEKISGDSSRRRHWACLKKCDEEDRPILMRREPKQEDPDTSGGFEGRKERREGPGNEKG